MTDFVNHTSDSGRIVMNDCMIQSAKAERVNDSLLISGFTDCAPSPSDFNFSHYIVANPVKRVSY